MVQWHSPPRCAKSWRRRARETFSADRNVIASRQTLLMGSTAIQGSSGVKFIVDTESHSRIGAPSTSGSARKSIR
eukprot:scaffold311403_cov30-Tisochrysis_lutea.AAC.2